MMREVLAELLELLRRLNRSYPTRVTMMRVMQGQDGLLPIGVAADLLGGPGKRDWILRNVRIRYVDGDQRVRWGDVIAATEPSATPVDEGTVPVVANLRRGIKR